MKKKLKIVITGASKGIGEKIASYLNKNHQIYNLSRSYSRNRSEKYIECDVTNFESVKSAFKIIGNFDVLINNAGISKFSKDNIKNFEKILITNLFGPYFCSMVAKKYLLKSKNASIINISSINAHLAFPNNPGYVASKGGLNALTRSLALDYSKKKIRVNSISPGYINAGMTRKSYGNLKTRLKRSSRTMLNRWGRPKDLNGIIEFLISDKSSYITGQDFVVDGGWISKGL